MINQRTISNVLLAVIAFTLGVIAFTTVNFNQEQRRATQNNHDELYALMGRHFGHVAAVNLTKEGRRLAAAQHFADQVVADGGMGRKGYKELLKHGSDGIEAYLSLPSRSSEVVRATKSFASHSAVYAFQVAMGETLFARSNRIEEDLPKAGKEQSTEQQNQNKEQ